MRVPAWLWLGGLLGAAFVAVSTFSIARVGAALLFAAVIFGQLLVSMVLDHNGLLGLQVTEATWQRLAALVLIFAGLVLFRVG